MRVIAVVGSLRRGNTYAMVESACHELTADCDVQLVHLRDMNMAFCDGCLACDDLGECHIHDSMEPLVRDIAAADGIILGTPARWANMSGELKAFIDRLNPLAAPDALRGKKAAVFAVGQSAPGDDMSVAFAAQSIKNFCDSAGIAVVAEVLAHECLQTPDLIELHPEVLANCKQAARELLKSMDG